MENTFDVIIIGAGASGMICAVTAARRGKKVLLLDKNPKPGRKILYTGNGRCNITNEHIAEEASNPVHYHGSFPKFVIPALNRFGLEDTRQFFSELGLETFKEDDGRYFPCSNQAKSVDDVLEFELKRLGVELQLESAVTGVSHLPETSLFKVVVGDRSYTATKLVIATGGKTLPMSGSTGDGYIFARKLGHKVVDIFPAYVGLKVSSKLCKLLQGMKLEVAVQIFSNGHQVGENTGTLMFAHYGLSAPVVLELSRTIAEQIYRYSKKITLKINFLPTIESDQLDSFLAKRFAKLSHKSLGVSFVGLLPHKLFPRILEANGISGEIKCSEVTKEMRKQIVDLLSAHEFNVDGVLGFEDAHFTAGGVNVKEVNPNTMESLLQPGLFFAGEVLDIDGDCGGYNLQWAWSSGYTAGHNV